MASTSMGWSVGSQWHRWDPHIHTPGTLLNNQFGNAWDAYLTAIERATPTVEALGITDYCVIDSYVRFRDEQKNGRAGNVSFVFPNVEFRLGVETKAGRGVNVHLLFSPDDHDHIAQIERVLGEFKFRYKDVEYPCTREWLMRLGRAASDRSIADAEALAHGANQFKLEWKTLVDVVARDGWARELPGRDITEHE